MAPLGSGKSTQIPQFLHEAGWTAGGRRVVCTQPRRIAATSISARVAEESGCKVGEDVGYVIRFDSKMSEQTSIKYCTDGILLRETMSDPLLSSYSVIMVDEAHERSLHSDILLGLLKKIQRVRPELRLIVTSATMNAVEMKDFFETNVSVDRNKLDDTSCIVPITGRMYPVDILYLKEPTSNYLKECVEVVIKIHTVESSGDGK
jgi:ATP-dependent RNA helicase DDX35